MLKTVSSFQKVLEKSQKKKKKILPAGSSITAPFENMCVDKPLKPGFLKSGKVIGLHEFILLMTKL